jgi:hypothetical protein
MNEKPAQDVRGTLLYNSITKKHFFRIYGEIDPQTKRRSFTDYKLSAEDIEVTINSKYLSLYESEDLTKNRLDFCSDLKFFKIEK